MSIVLEFHYAVTEMKSNSKCKAIFVDVYSMILIAGISNCKCYDIYRRLTKNRLDDWTFAATSGSLNLWRLHCLFGKLVW